MTLMMSMATSVFFVYNATVRNSCKFTQAIAFQKKQKVNTDELFVKEFESIKMSSQIMRAQQLPSMNNNSFFNP